LRAEGRTLLLGRPLDGGTNFGTRFQVPVPAISADGSRVAFASESEHLIEGDSNRRTDAFVFDSASVTLRRVGLATGAALPAGASGIGWRPDTLETVFASRGGSTPSSVSRPTTCFCREPPVHCTSTRAGG